MAENIDDDSSVGFLFKTMLERDPRKRRVKPVQKEFLQLDFAGLDDSEDDSDFDVGKYGGGDDSDIFSEDANSDDNDDNDSSGSDSDGNDNGDSDGSNEEMSLADLLDMAKSKAESRQKKQQESNGGAASASASSSTVAKVTPASGPVHLNIRICCICLGERSGEEDEIVECDECGISVHEGCYGISESLSVASTVSSASTEPWFCDACKAGVKPTCELCPNSGGIYKETDAGRWVHLVCALYTPGVAFGEVDKLSNITLFEMPYTRWGSRECSLCEDERLCRSGVCISCDAGMCRNYFHVSCAQREGLLSEASPEEDIADPFYAYCKQHADKGMVKVKRRNWLALQSQQRNGRQPEIDDDKERMRVQRKLTRHRQKYEIAKAKRPPAWVPTEKQPRMLSTCPIALKQLLKKAELLGITPSTQEIHNKGDIRKKWHLAPAFSTEFISYYFDRNERMTQMQKKLTDLILQNEALTSQEADIRVKYDELHEETEELKICNGKLREDGEKLWKVLAAVSDKPLPMPEIYKPRKAAPRSPSKRDNPKSPNRLLHKCGICGSTNDQHLLAKCDMCRLFYHLGCLDPPLTRMPKKTKLMGWQCSECDKSGGEETPAQLNPNAPRRLRDHIKLPKKFANMPSPSLVVKKRKMGERKRNKTPKQEALDEEAKEKQMAILKKGLESAEKKKRVSDPPLNVTITPLAKRPSTSPYRLASPLSPKFGKSPTKPGDSPFKSGKLISLLKPVRATSPVNMSPVKSPTKMISPVKLASPAKMASPVKLGSPTKAPIKTSPGSPIKSSVKTSPDKPQSPKKSVESLPDISEDVKIISASLASLEAKKAEVLKISPKRGKSKKSKDNRTECIVCSLSGNNRTLVRCDECKFCYHFYCVDPPLKKSPKVRGYSWHCHNCDPSESEEEECEDEESDEEVKEEVDTQQFIIETGTSGDMTISKVVPYKMIGARSQSPAFQIELIEPRGVIQDPQLIEDDDDDDVVMISDED